MRYVRWILMLLILIFIIMQVVYNFESMGQNFMVVIQVPGTKLFEGEIEIWLALLGVFLIGFGIAIALELYYWFKYSMTIRNQNKLILGLQEELAALKPAQDAPATPAPAESKPSKS
jgi:hypothetical protein